MYQIMNTNAVLVQGSASEYVDFLPLDSSGDIPSSILIQSSGLIKFSFIFRYHPEQVATAVSFYHTGNHVIMNVTLRDFYEKYKIQNLSGSNITVAITPLD